MSLLFLSSYFGFLIFRKSNEPLSIVNHLKSFYGGEIPTKARHTIAEEEAKALVVMAYSSEDSPDRLRKNDMLALKDGITLEHICRATDLLFKNDACDKDTELSRLSLVVRLVQTARLQTVKPVPERKRITRDRAPKKNVFFLTNSEPRSSMGPIIQVSHCSFIVTKFSCGYDSKVLLSARLSHDDLFDQIKNRFSFNVLCECFWNLRFV